MEFKQALAHLFLIISGSFDYFLMGFRGINWKSNWTGAGKRSNWIGIKKWEKSKKLGN